MNSKIMIMMMMMMMMMIKELFQEGISQGTTG
jgi:hypothetical protein